MGVATIIGSAWIAFLLIPGACLLALVFTESKVTSGGSGAGALPPQHALTLQPYPLLRDSVVYLVLLLIIYWYWGFERQIHLSE